jgi:hypothetical protein
MIAAGEVVATVVARNEGAFLDLRMNGGRQGKAGDGAYRRRAAFEGWRACQEGIMSASG